MAPDIRIDESKNTVLIYGVSYSFAFFEAMAKRMGAGTVVDVVIRGDGSPGFTSFRPGPSAKHPDIETAWQTPGGG